MLPCSREGQPPGTSCRFLSKTCVVSGLQAGWFRVYGIKFVRVFEEDAVSYRSYVISPAKYALNPIALTPSTLTLHIPSLYKHPYLYTYVYIYMQQAYIPIYCLLPPLKGVIPKPFLFILDLTLKPWAPRMGP